MEEIRIDEAIEKEEKQEEQDQLNLVPEEESKENKKEGRNILLMVVIILGIFVLFTGGFKAYNSFTGAEIISLDYLHQKNLEGKLDESRGYLYEGYSFVFFDGLWWTQIMNGNVLTKIPIHFGPKNLTDINIEGKLGDGFNKGEIVYIAIDPEFTDKYYTLALSELNFNVVKGILRKPEAVCIKEHEICDDRKILSCENTEGKPVIELKHANETRVIFKDTCILIQGTEYEIVKATNRVILQWYGIMN